MSNHFDLHGIAWSDLVHPTFTEIEKQDFINWLEESDEHRTSA
jgi:hypothetical protein